MHSNLLASGCAFESCSHFPHRGALQIQVMFQHEGITLGAIRAGAHLFTLYGPHAPRRRAACASLPPLRSW